MIQINFSEVTIKVPIAANESDVCFQNTSKSHSYHLKYGDYFDFIDRQWCSS